MRARGGLALALLLVAAVAADAAGPRGRLQALDALDGRDVETRRLAAAARAEHYLRLGDPARALVCFERALAVNPNLSQVEETVEALRRQLLERRKDTI